MNLNAKLTNQEIKVAEMIAWGAAKKEIADKLHLSVRTIENHTRNIFAKIEIQKSTELSVYWFCTQYKISLKDSPINFKNTDFFLLMFFVWLIILCIYKFLIHY